jgi:hypothetical protein
MSCGICHAGDLSVRCSVATITQRFGNVDSPDIAAASEIGERPRDP